MTENFLRVIAFLFVLLAIVSGCEKEDPRREAAVGCFMAQLEIERKTHLVAERLEKLKESGVSKFSTRYQNESKKASEEVMDLLMQRLVIVNENSRCIAARGYDLPNEEKNILRNALGLPEVEEPTSLQNYENCSGSRC